MKSLTCSLTETRRRVAILSVVGGLTVALLAMPLAARAQPPTGKAARIGYMTSRPGPSHLEEAFRRGLRDLGYLEGQNLSIEYRWANFKSERSAAFATEFVGLPVDLIVTTGGAEPALAAKRATTTIPVLFTAGDPLRAGLVSNLGRPGGNLTGLHILTIELNTKRLELLREALPRLSRVAVLHNPTNPTAAPALKDLMDAAQTLRLKVQVLDVPGPDGIETAFAALAKGRAEALLVMSDAMLHGQRERIVELAARNRVPGIFEWREFAEVGGLLSYGTHLPDMYRRLATYVDRILKGAKPGELPVEQPTKFELVINMKTARALGLTIPPSVLARADQVIE
jgi:putative ABC transport system substrate-binding protein